MGRFATVKKAIKENPLYIVLASLCILMFIGLKFWNAYAPVSIHDWNKKEISRIKVTNPEDINFAVFGDNKGNIVVFEPLLRDIGHNPEIAFAIDIGDLVSTGERRLFRLFLNQVQKSCAIPFLTAVGNHDVKHGDKKYREIFGPTHYGFQVGQSYFIVLDATTESCFYKEERQWLVEELEKSQASKVRFVFMHVPPFDPRGSGFNKCLPEKDGKDLLSLFRRYNVTHLFASHIHGYFSGVWEGVPYTVTGGAGGRLQGSDPQHFFYHYMKVHVSNGKVEMMVRRVNEGNAIAQIFDQINYDMVELGLLVAAGILLFIPGLSAVRKHGS